MVDNRPENRRSEAPFDDPESSIAFTVTYLEQPASEQNRVPLSLLRRCPYQAWQVRRPCAIIFDNWGSKWWG